MEVNQEFGGSRILVQLIMALFFTRWESRVMPHLLCSQGLAVPEYSFALDALDLRHPRFLQHPG